MQFYISTTQFFLYKYDTIYANTLLLLATTVFILNFSGPDSCFANATACNELSMPPSVTTHTFGLAPCVE
ncbi:hypothetical protein BD408DRAFT_414156, partial [Parasitella parasitica]